MKKLLYPLFLPLVVWWWLFAIWCGLFSGPMPPEITGPSGSNGFLAVAFAFVALFIGAAAQLVVGLPSCWLLRRWRSLSIHLVAGALLGCSLTVLVSILFREPKFNEGVLSALPGIAVFLLPPFFAGYVRLYFLHRAASA